MPPENVEVVRGACEAWAGAGELVLDILHSEVEWDTTHFEGWPEKRVYRGREEISAFLDEWLGSWESYDATVDEVRDAGDRVVALWSQRMRGPGSGVPVEMDSAQVWTIQDGLVIRIEHYSDQSEALEAVGLRE